MEKEYDAELLVGEAIEDNFVATVGETCNVLYNSMLQKLQKESRAYLVAGECEPRVGMVTPFVNDDGNLCDVTFPLEDLASGLVKLRDSKKELIDMAEAFEKYAKDFREEAERMSQND